jgi:hypothetical protein
MHEFGSRLTCNKEVSFAGHVQLSPFQHQLCGLRMATCASLAAALAAVESITDQSLDVVRAGCSAAAATRSTCTAILHTVAIGVNRSTASLHWQQSRQPAADVTVSSALLEPPLAMHVPAAAAAARSAAASLGAVLRGGILHSKHRAERTSPAIVSHLMCALTTLLPAASAARMPHTSPEASVAAMCAAAAAVPICRCLALVLSRMPISASVVRDALAQAETHGQCSVGRALALVICGTPQAPRGVQAAAATALAVLVATNERAALVLAGDSCPDNSPLDAPPPHGTRLGAELAAGLLHIVQAAGNCGNCSEKRGSSPLATLSCNSVNSTPHAPSHMGLHKRLSVMSSMDPDVLELLRVSNAALQALLAFSQSAKVYILEEGIEKQWVREAVEACEVLASKPRPERPQVPVHWHACRVYCVVCCLIRFLSGSSGDR